MKDLIKALSLGTTVCFGLIVPTISGVLLDRYFNTAPLWILFGVVVGFCSALWTLKELIK